VSIFFLRAGRRIVIPATRAAAVAIAPSARGASTGPARDPGHRSFRQIRGVD